MIFFQKKYLYTPIPPRKNRKMYYIRNTKIPKICLRSVKNPWQTPETCTIIFPTFKKTWCTYAIRLRASTPPYVTSTSHVLQHHTRPRTCPQSDIAHAPHFFHFSKNYTIFRNLSNPKPKPLTLGIFWSYPHSRSFNPWQYIYPVYIDSWVSKRKALTLTLSAQ